MLQVSRPVHDDGERCRGRLFGEIVDEKALAVGGNIIIIPGDWITGEARLEERFGPADLERQTGETSSHKG